VNIQFGLVIQGAVTTLGSGPNNSKDGFSTDSVIRANIDAFAPYCKKIVISTWKNSGLEPKEFAGGG
jgi:hypothetical protein